MALPGTTAVREYQDDRGLPRAATGTAANTAEWGWTLQPRILEQHQSEQLGGEVGSRSRQRRQA